MITKMDILSKFSDSPSSSLLFLPDLILWYNWHKSKGTLPEQWQGLSLPEISQELDLPIWRVTRPWKLETPEVEITTTEEGGERIIRRETSVGILESRWSLGPDGDWWQAEYPVKSAEDLDALVELAQAITYTPDPQSLSALHAMVGDQGVVALELPRRAYSDVLHDFLGWGEGLMLLGDPRVQDVLSILEDKLQILVEDVSHMPGDLIFSPDNLDGQFISPRTFKRYLAKSYQGSAEILHQANKPFVVHVGGPIKHLLKPLTAAGVDGIEGVCGPPQSDVSLAEARELAGSDLTLWGGIPQDFVLATHEQHTFEAAVKQAVQEARDTPRIILGVADRVPVDVEFERLHMISELIQSD